MANFSPASSLGFFENQGPETIEELAQWDDRLIAHCRKLGLAARAMDTVRSGMLASTDYSGFDFPKEPVRIVVSALARA